MKLLLTDPQLRWMTLHLVFLLACIALLLTTFYWALYRCNQTVLHLMLGAGLMYNLGLLERWLSRKSGFPGAPAAAGIPPSSF